MEGNQSVQVYERLTVEVSPIVEQAKAIVVRNEADYNRAAMFLTEVKAKSKLVEEERVKVSKPMNDALRAHNDLFKRLSGPLDMAEFTVKRTMSEWFAEQKRIQDEVARKAAEDARRREEAERAKLQRQAEAATAKGRTEKAEELQQQAASVYIEPAYVPEPADTTVVLPGGSVTMRQDIEVEVVDPYQLLEAIMKDELPLAWIKIDTQAIKRRAKADGLMPGAKSIPGVRIKPALISAVRTIRSQN